MKLIDRPSIVAQLRNAARQHALTLVVAPLGSGKTASLTLAFEAEAAFVRLDLETRHRGAFVPAIVAAVRERRAGFGRLTLGALSAGASAEHLARTFATELGHVASPLVLALDNAHLLDDDPGFGAFISTAEALLPEPVRLVLAGRALPQFDLAGAFARGRATIVSDGFRFGAAEILALAMALGRTLDEAQCEALERATDGWAAGIVLALVTSPAIAGIGSIASATAYLESALLPALAPDVVAFLEDTAVFETLDAALLEGSGSYPNARAMLRDVRRGGALIAEVPGTARLRLNPLLRDLALRRLAARDGTAAAHGAAAATCAAADAMSSALYHAVSSQDARVAGTFLRAHALAAVATGDRARVLAATALIDPAGPDADVAAFAWGLEAKAAGSSASRDSFARAAAAAERREDPAIAFFARAQTIEYDLGRLRIDAGDLRAVRAAAQPLGPIAIATAEMLAGWAEAIGFDFDAARARVTPLVQAGEARARFDTGVLLAYVQTALGECDEAERTLEALVRLLEDDDRVVLLTLALVWFARLAVAWGAIDVASDAAAQAERLAMALALRAEEAALFSVLMELATHRGDVAATIGYAERARERARSAWYVADVGRVRAFADVAAARAAFLTHEHATAFDLARRAGEVPGCPQPTRALALAEAAVYALLSEPNAAPAAIAAARDAARLAVPVDVGDAVALATAGDLLSFLAAANGEPISERYPVPGPFSALIDARRGLVSLEIAGIAVGNARRERGSAEAPAAAFERYERNGPRFEARLARAYAARFIKSAKKPIAAAGALDLTLREREILTLLVDGLANKELAERLGVSPRTVETHVERVLGKLEVGSRSRAIAKALRLGIVELETLRP